MYIVINGHEEILDKLIKNGPKINYKIRIRLNSSICAYINKEEKVEKLLLP